MALTPQEIVVSVENSIRDLNREISNIETSMVKAINSAKPDVLIKSWSDVVGKIKSVISPSDHILKNLEKQIIALDALKSARDSYNSALLQNDTIQTDISNKIKDFNAELTLQANLYRTATAGSTAKVEALHKILTINSAINELEEIQTEYNKRKNIILSEICIIKQKIKELEEETIPSSQKSLTIWRMIENTLKIISSIAIKFDKTIGDIAVKSGLTASNFKNQQGDLLALANTSSEFGGNLEAAAEAMRTMRDMIGLIGVGKFEDINKEIIYMKTNLGLSMEDAGRFFQTMSEISSKTIDSQQNMGYFAENVAKANGVPIVKMLGQIAKISDSVRVIFRGNTQELIKQTAEVMKLGSSLDSAAKSSAALLNYQDSITMELEASALSGKNFSFQAARDAGYRGDFAAQERLITEELKRHGDLNELDYFTRQSIMKATGKEWEELQKMVAQDENRVKLRSKYPELANEERQAQQKIADIQREMDSQRDLADKNRETNQTNINIITKQYEQLMVNIGATLQPIVEFLAAGVFYALKLLNIITGLTAGLNSFGKIAVVILSVIIAIKVSIMAVNLALKTLGSTGKSVIAKLLTSLPASITAISTSLSASITAISTSLSASIRGIFAALGTIPWSIVLQGSVAILAMAGGFWILSKAFAAWPKDITGDYLRDLSTGLIAIGLAFLAIGALASVAWELLAIGAIALVGFAAVLGIVGLAVGYFADQVMRLIPLFAILSKLDGTNLILVGSAFYLFGTGLLSMMFAVAIFPISKLEKILITMNKFSPLVDMFNRLSTSIETLSKINFLSITEGLKSIGDVKLSVDFEKDLVSRIEKLSDLSESKLLPSKLSEKPQINVDTLEYDNNASFASSNQKVVDAINSLITNLLNGNIKVYLDSEKVGYLIGNNVMNGKR